MVDTSKLKPGDVVHVRMTVRQVYEMGGMFAADCNWLREGLNLSDIVHIEPRPFQVGDRVLAFGGAGGEIITVYEDKAWIRLDDMHDFLVQICDLERIPE